MEILSERHPLIKHINDYKNNLFISKLKRQKYDALLNQLIEEDIKNLKKSHFKNARIFERALTSDIEFIKNKIVVLQTSITLANNIPKGILTGLTFKANAINLYQNNLKPAYDKLLLLQLPIPINNKADNSEEEDSLKLKEVAILSSYIYHHETKEIAVFKIKVRELVRLLELINKNLGNIKSYQAELYKYSRLSPQPISKKTADILLKNKISLKLPIEESI